MIKNVYGLRNIFSTHIISVSLANSNYLFKGIVFSKTLICNSNDHVYSFGFDGSMSFGFCISLKVLFLFA